MTPEERQEYMREYKRAYRQAHCLQLRQAQRKYYHKHKDKARAYYEKNKERINAYSREYYHDCKWKWEDFYRPRAIIKAAKEKQE